MKIFFKDILFFIINISISQSENFKFQKLNALNDPWGSSFISNNELIISEKGGKIKLIELNKRNL